jgi:lactoylglutathione lyase
MIIEERRITVITDLGHPAFAVHDIDATLSFYRILGIEEAFRLNHNDDSLMLVYLHVSGDRFIEVFPSGPPPTQIGNRASSISACLPTISTRPSSVCARAAPIDYEPLVGLDGNLQAWTRDPNGNEIELMQLSEDSPQRQTARSA